MEVEVLVSEVTPIFVLIFHLVGFKEASMPNFRFLGCLEVLWLEDNKQKT
jgi:hypothetical protein